MVTVVCEMEAVVNAAIKANGAIAIRKVHRLRVTMSVTTTDSD